MSNNSTRYLDDYPHYSSAKLPASSEIERSILGALLIYYEHREKAFNTLHEKDFTEYRPVFLAMQKLFREAGTFELSDLETVLKETNYESFANELLDIQSDTTTDIQHSINRLKKYSKRREALQLTNSISQALQVDAGDAEQYISQLNSLSLDGNNIEWWKPVNPYKEPVEPLEFIIEGFAAKGMITMIGGTAGSGKSILIQFLMQLRESQSLLTTKSGNGVFLTGLDSSETEIRRRAKSLGPGYGLLTVEIPDDIIPFITNQKFFKELKDHLINTEADIVVFDTVADFHGGNLYDAAEVLSTMSAFRRLATATGCAIVLITHTRKSADAKANYSINDIADSRIFSTKSDFVFALKSEYQTDSSNLIELQCLKSRSPKPLPPIKALIKLNDQSNQVSIESSDRPFSAEAEKMKQQEKIQERQKLAIELYNNGMSKREIAEQLGVSHTTINNDLKGYSK